MCKQAKWDDPDLTEKVAWAMGVEAAGVTALANCGPLDHEARHSDWISWLQGRDHKGLSSVYIGMLPVPVEALVVEAEVRRQGFYHFQHGWQAQRAELLAEHIGKVLSDAMHQFCLEGQQSDSIFEQFTGRLDLDGWFAGAGERGVQR